MNKYLIIALNEKLKREFDNGDLEIYVSQRAKQVHLALKKPLASFNFGYKEWTRNDVYKQRKS